MVAVAVVRSAGTDGGAGVDVDVFAPQADGDGATQWGRLQRRACEDLTVTRPAVVGPLADEPVGHADERRDVLGRRTLEDMFGGVVLLDASVAHDGQPVTEGERLGLVVGDEHGREAESTVELVDLGPHLVAETGVEVAERFVEQDQVGSGDEAAGERDALLLATAELCRIAVEERSAIHEGRGLLDPTALEALLDPPRLEGVVDVLAHRHVRPQRVRLEHHADVALVRRQVDPAFGVEHRGRAEADLASARCFQAGEAPQRRRLAAPARTEEDEELALLDLEIEVVDSLRRRLPVEVHRHRLDADVGHVVTSLRVLGLRSVVGGTVDRST